MKKISELQRESEETSFLNEDNCYGRFYLHKELNEMARFGKIPDSKYEIHIESVEGYVPHMHICIKTGKNIILRIELLTNTYFREKDDVCNVLSANERKALDRYLSEMYNDEFGISRWQNLCMQWNEYNPGHKIQNIKTREKPDYRTINEPK